MYNEELIAKLKKNVLERCQDRIIDAKNNKVEKIMDFEEHSIVSKTKRNRGL
jgi:hypothetical protein